MLRRIWARLRRSPYVRNTCGHCNGTTTILLGLDATEPVTCDRCEGTGYIWIKCTWAERRLNDRQAQAARRFWNQQEGLSVAADIFRQAMMEAQKEFSDAMYGEDSMNNWST